MKAITQAVLDYKMIGRAIIDRKRKINSSILQEQRAIDRECNANLTASTLYSYYISICQNVTWDLMADDKVAHQLGSTTRAVAVHRRKLAKLGWIRFDKYTHKGVEYGIWYIGKKVVSANLTSNTRLEELNSIGIITDEEYASSQDTEELFINTTKEVIEND